MRRPQFPPIPASEITPESTWLRRRDLLRMAAATLPALAAGCGADDGAAAAAPTPPPGPALAGVTPGPFSTDEPQTSWRDATNYNNYYEFGTDKNDPARNSRDFRPAPWTVTIAGHAEATGTFALEDLLRPHALEERVYRMRCVEGWSMVIPWVGFPLKALIERAKPTSKAKFVAFTTLHDPERMPGQRWPVLDWPYTEGLRIDEATHPLTLLATGLYGRALPNQNGAPLRLVVPWKYGFKGIKGIVRIEFTEEMPATAWNRAAPREYGFYSNVNPDVDHPRWSQATERRIAGDFAFAATRIPTLPFNGYAEQVAALYTGMDLRRWF